MRKFKIRTKDHFHFTNMCCLCWSDDHDDSAMVPITVERNGYFESDYCCTMCVVRIDVNEIDMSEVNRFLKVNA